MESLIAFTAAKHDKTSANDVLGFSIFWTCQKEMPKGGYFDIFEFLGDYISFLMKKVNMYSKNRTHGSLT